MDEQQQHNRWLEPLGCVVGVLVVLAVVLFIIHHYIDKTW